MCDGGCIVGYSRAEEFKDIVLAISTRRGVLGVMYFKRKLKIYIGCC